MARTVQVDIYILAGCNGETQARQTALQLVADWGAACMVRILDLAAPEIERPASVFATPTYLVNGQVISLGTPSRADLANAIRCAQFQEQE